MPIAVHLLCADAGAGAGAAAVSTRPKTRNISSLRQGLYNDDKKRSFLVYTKTAWFEGG